GRTEDLRDDRCRAVVIAVGMPLQRLRAVVSPGGSATARVLGHPSLDGRAYVARHFGGRPQRQQRLVFESSRGDELRDSRLLSRPALALFERAHFRTHRGDGELLDIWNGEELRNSNDEFTGSDLIRLR